MHWEITILNFERKIRTWRSVVRIPVQVWIFLLMSKIEILCKLYTAIFHTNYLKYNLKESDITDECHVDILFCNPGFWSVPSVGFPFLYIFQSISIYYFYLRHCFFALLLTLYCIFQFNPWSFFSRFSFYSQKYYFSHKFNF